jgi:hypothetical protein
MVLVKHPSPSSIHLGAIALRRRLCHDRGMANEKPKEQAEGKFAEAMRKSKEKRQGMQQQSERRAQEKEETLQREEANRPGQAFDAKDDSTNH